MKYRFQLRHTILALLLLLGVVLVVVTVWHDLDSAMETIQEESRRQIASIGGQTASRLEYHLGRDEQVQVERIISVLKTDPHLTLAVVFDETNRVIASTDIELIGKMAPDTPAAEQLNLLDTARQRLSAQIAIEADGDTQGGAFPVLMGLLPGEARPSRHGILYLNMDLLTRKRIEFTNSGERAVMISVIVLAMLSATWWYVNIALNRRAAKLIAATDAIASGNLASRADLHGQDELAQLSASINAMASRLQTQTEDLRRSRDQTSLLLNSTSEGIYGMDQNCRCTFANPACLRLLGAKDVSELMGKPIHDIIHHSHPDGRPMPKSECRICFNAKQGREFHTDDEVFWRLDGSCFPVEYWSHPQAVGDRIVGTVVAFVDITKRKQAEDELVELNQQLERRVAERTAEAMDLYQNAPCGYHSVDASGLILEMNATELKWLGYTREEVVNRMKFQDLLTPASTPAFQQVHSKTVETCSGRSREWELLRKDGSILPILCTVECVADSNGKFVRTRATAVDMTSHKKAEEALRLSERTHRIVADNTYDWEFWIDPHGRFLYCSPSCSRITGHNASEFMADPDLLSRITHPDDQGIYDKIKTPKLTLPQTGEVAFRIIKPDGIERWIGHVSQSVFDENGNWLGRRGSNRDITDRKRADHRIQQQFRLQQLLMDLSSTYINLPLEKVETTIQKSLGELAKFVEVDRVYIFEYDFKRQTARNTHEWCGDGISSHIGELQDVPITGSPGWVEAHRLGKPNIIPDVSAMPPGDLKEMLISQSVQSLVAVPLMNGEECLGFVGFDVVRKLRIFTGEERQLLRIFAQMLVNIRLRQQTQQALQTERQRLAGILSSTNVGTWEWNIQTGEILLNERWAEIKGYTLAELQPLTVETVRSFVHPDELQFTQELLAKHFRGELEHYILEARMRHKDGSWVWVQEHGRVMAWTPNCKPLLMQGTQQDITARKRLEATLKESEELYRGLFENSRDAIITTDVTGRMLDCNQAALTMFRLADKAQLISLGPLALSPDFQPDGRSSAQAFGEAVSIALSSGSNFIEWWHKRPDGTMFPSEISISAIQVRGQSLLQGMVSDISQRKAAEAELRASEAKFRRLIEFAPVPMAFLHWGGDIEFVNTQFSRVFGYTSEDTPHLGKWWPRAFPDSAYRDEILVLWNTTIAKAIESGETSLSFPGEYRITGSNGQQHITVISGQLMDERILVVIQDITAIKQAADKLRKLSQAVEFSPSMILITDRAGRVEYTNPAWEQCTGYTLAEVLGQRSRALKSGVHPREFYEYLWEEITAGRIWRGEFCNRRKNGELYWEAAAIAPVHDEAGVITHFVAVKEDITLSKQAAEELRASKEAAESANRAKSVFLANMSHEIRTPMNAILGFSQLILRDATISPTHRQQVSTINRSGEHLLDIINDILEMARIESGRVTLNPATFDLPLLLDDLERMFSLRAQTKHLRFRVERLGDLPRFVVADETKLRQVIINLIGNAVKFTPSGGEITVRVSGTTHPEGGLGLHVEVEDTGAGIDAEDLPHLFEPFFQTRVGRQTGGGTGLGLAISREFAHLMGGNLTVSSRPGIGSIFTFDARVAWGHEVAQHNPSERRILHLLPGQPARRILVVDDKMDNRDLLEQVLSPIGFEVRTARDGSEAVSMCSSWRPHLVVLDLRMPGMDGYDAARHIRAEHGASIKIIALSASVFGPDQQRAISAGADIFIPKPFEETDLLERIQSLIAVDYVYDDPAAHEPQPKAPSGPEVPTAAEIASLPRELVAALHEATCRAEYDQMLALAEQVATINPSISACLAKMVTSFDYVTLRSALSAGLENK